MGTFYINVSAGGDGRVPVGVAGSVMVGVQRLLADIGRHSVAKALMLQGDVPPELLSRFTLYVDGSPSSVSSSADMRFDGGSNMLREALDEIVSLIDCVSGGSAEGVLERYPDPRYRVPILEDLLFLSDSLGDLHLNCSMDGRESSLSAEAAAYVAGLLDDRCGSFLGCVFGILRECDGGVYLETDNGDVPLMCGAAGGPPGMPCAVSGRISLYSDGTVEKMTDICGLDELSSLSFGRAVSSDSDLVLGGPLAADVGYDDEHGLWTLSNEPLGISLSKEDLDDAILEFHDHFMFMWEVYDKSSEDGDPEEDFAEDELRLRNYILSIAKDR